MIGDTLANCERIEPAPGEPEAVPGYWRGGAVAEVEHWRARALAAEAIVERLRRQLARYRYRP